MAKKIDNLLRALTKYDAEQLIFRSEEKPVLMIKGEIRPVTQVALKSKQIIGILKEIAADVYQPNLIKGESVSFDYLLEGVGNFNVQVDVDGSNVLAIIQKGAPQEDKAETFDAPQPPEEPKEEPGKEPSELPRQGGPKKPPPSGSPEEFSFDTTVSGRRHRPTLHKLFESVIEKGASDLYLCSSAYPRMRVNNKIVICDEHEEISPNELKEIIYKYMKGNLISRFDTERDVEFSIEMPDLGRFRARLFMDMKGIGAIFRHIPSSPPSFGELGIPKGVSHICELDRGLVIITGPPSSGKTSTLAAIIEQVNQTKSKHVVSFERPIEFVYQNNKCIINQREVNIHTPSIESGLKASLMAPPDILVAERIDSPRAIRSALELADSGCLVIITLYTDSVISTIDFIINSFPDEEKDLIRLLLSKNLKGIVSQTLLLPKKGHKRVAAFEVLLYSPLVANLINTQKHNQIPGVIKSNKEHGMINLGDSLLEMVRNDQVSPEEAYEKSVDKIAFSQLLQMSSIKLDLNKRFYN